MELLMPFEAAKRLGVTPDAIRAIERKGKLRSLKTESGRRLFEKSEIDRMKRERQLKLSRKARKEDDAD